AEERRSGGAEERSSGGAEERRSGGSKTSPKIGMIYFLEFPKGDGK
ncbi:MAG: hypothetical protein F6K41_36110, partial [Symploca sp. SIO3E6]|nr:hypothetical protein [Caldora sp. SIO3E6]